MQALQHFKLPLASGPRCERGRALVWLRAASLALFVLVSAVIFPISACADSKSPESKVSSLVAHSDNKEQTHDIDNPWLDIVLLGVLSFLFCLLGLLKDFRRYRGLLPILFSNMYSWVFIIFTTTCIFAVDYVMYQFMYRSSVLHNFMTESMMHLSLALGHTGISAASVYLSPMLLSVIPTHARAVSEQPHNQPEKEKPITEMNVVYAAIRELLENQVNSRVSDWTDLYSWPVIKSTGKMLLTDLLNSGTISREEFQSAKLEEGAFEGDSDFWEDRQRKYDLLRKIMKHSCYQDLSLRLERTSRVKSPGVAA